MKKISLFIISFLSIISISAQKYSSGGNFPYHNPTPGEITIMACSPASDGLDPTYDLFQGVEDCGFNTITCTGSVEYFKKIFALMEPTNLKCLISNRQFTEAGIRKQYMNAFNKNKHLGGWLLRDEPPFDIWDNLKVAYKDFYKEDGNKLVYVNLVGILEKTFTGQSKSINEYLAAFQNKFTPALWSYDFYPIITRRGKTTVSYDQFYSDLEDFSSMAKSTDRPFWAFCESIAYSTSSYSRPVPTEAYFKFQAYNALAYGAQGIVYWAYGMRKPSSGETFKSALIDFKGKRSKAWYAAQKVNNQIKKFNDVFFECEVREVRHTGDKIYSGTHKLSGSFGPFSMIRSGAAGLVVSRIENKGDKYIVIVNRDVSNKQKITLELSANKKIVNLTSSNQQQYSGVTDINLTLDKADWAIFKEI